MTIQREHLTTSTIDRHIDRIETHRIRLAPGQRAGLHIHAGGVVGHVTEGRIAYQLAGEPVRELNPGDAFHEPAGATVARFDNLSDTTPAEFIAYYLLAGRQPLITFL